MEEGFRSSKDNEAIGEPSANILTNSIGLADLARIKSFMSAQNRNSSFDLPTGSILICKVYLGEETVDPEHPEYSSDKSLEEIWEEAGLSAQETRPIYRNLTAETKQKIWLLHDHLIILPEYLIEFDYKSASTGDGLPANFEELTGFNAKNLELAELSSITPLINGYLEKFDAVASIQADTDIDPSIPERSVADEITVPLIVDVSRTTLTASIRYLNLSRNAITEI